MTKIIANCRLYTDPPGMLTHVAIEAGKIRDVLRKIPPGADILFDAGGMTAAPGLIDTHVHGAGGGDLSDGSPEGFHTAAAALCALGTTSFYATSFYLPGGANRHLQRLGRERPAKGEADCPGIHLEGPFINPRKKGGIPAAYLADPDIAVLDDILARTREKLALLTCAPELPGMAEILRVCREKGIIASFGHSDAGTAETREGFARGMGCVTHLANAMRPFHHRDPGPLPAVLASGAPVQLISDGVHLHADAVRFFYDIFGAARCICITDGIECTGLPDGEYRFREKPYRSENGAVFYSDGSGLIGTSLSLFEIVMRFKEFTGCSLAEAIDAGSVNPARCMGIDDRKGYIKPGYDADMIFFGADHALRKVVKSGIVI